MERSAKVLPFVRPVTPPPFEPERYEFKKTASEVNEAYFVSIRIAFAMLALDYPGMKAFVERFEGEALQDIADKFKFVGDSLVIFSAALEVAMTRVNIVLEAMGRPELQPTPDASSSTPSA